jgi:hypothetical protein
MDPLTFFVASNHLKVRLQRLALYPDLWIHPTEDTVALEIKGLKTSMLKVAQRIESLNAKAARFDEVGSKLEADMDSIIEQAEEHAEDLSFAAQVLGNSTSGGSSDENKTDTKTEPSPEQRLTVNGVQAGS